jgi:hypothetical protein
MPKNVIFRSPLFFPVIMVVKPKKLASLAVENHQILAGLGFWNLSGHLDWFYSFFRGGGDEKPVRQVLPAWTIFVNFPP